MCAGDSTAFAVTVADVHSSKNGGTATLHLVTVAAAVVAVVAATTVAVAVALLVHLLLCDAAVLLVPFEIKVAAAW
jgi:hypothetical protein